MSKIYTAQDMRRLILKIKGYLGGVVGKEDYEFLNRMADALEREEKREKKYEYKVLFRRCDGRVYDSIGHTQNIQLAREILGVYSGYKDAHIVRRPVGEWEEVRA